MLCVVKGVRNIFLLRLKNVVCSCDNSLCVDQKEVKNQRFEAENRNLEKFVPIIKT